jgi:hypothetical protein
MPSALKIQETGKANDGVAGVIEAQRLLGPVVVARTLGVLDSGTALMFVGTGLRQGVLLLHGASFLVTCWTQHAWPRVTG